MRPTIFKLMDAELERRAAFDDWITLSGRDNNGNKHGGAHVLLDDDGTIVYGLGGGHRGKKLGEALGEIKRDSAAQRGQGYLFSEVKKQARAERKQAQAEKMERQKKERAERSAQRKEEKAREESEKNNENLKSELRRAVRFFGLKNRDEEVENALKQAAAHKQENIDAERLTGVKVAMEGGLMQQVLATREGIRIAKPELERLRSAKSLEEVDHIRDEAMKRLNNRLEYKTEAIVNNRLAVFVRQNDKLLPEQRKQFEAALGQVRHNFNLARTQIRRAVEYARENFNDEENVPF